MKVFLSPLSNQQIADLQKIHGDYVKLTIDLGQKIMVAGCDLHADGKNVLLEEHQSRQDNIWGGGINLTNGQADRTAVLNLRPNLGNNGLEIIEPRRWDAFFEIIESYFKKLKC